MHHLDKQVSSYNSDVLHVIVVRNNSLPAKECEKHNKFENTSLNVVSHKVGSLDSYYVTICTGANMHLNKLQNTSGHAGCFDHRDLLPINIHALSHVLRSLK